MRRATALVARARAIGAAAGLGVFLSLGAGAAVGGEPRVDLALIEASALGRNPSGWVVLDARPRAEWLAGHIPGARSFSWEDYTRTDPRGVPYKVWPPEELGRALAGLGVDEKTPVAVYGDADTSWGGEGWDCWVLAWLGHRGPIRLVAGGIEAWRRQGLPLASGPENRVVPRPRYEVRPRTALDVGTAELDRGRAGAAVVDTRSTVDWLLGRIPGAVHIPWTEFYAGPDRRPLAPEAVQRLLESRGVNAAGPVIYYCAGGIRSAYAWTVHALAGLPGGRNYEGGMEEWKRLH